VSAARQKVRLSLLVAAAALAAFSLARPQWGYIYQEAHQQGLDIVVAIDASKSMLATDITPTRLARAKLAALDLMKLAKNDRLALVAFSGTAFLQSPLTLDEEAFRQSVNCVDPSTMPKGGTALAAAIESALDAFEKNNNNHKVLVVLTDGEDHDADTETIAAAEKAAKAGMKIFTIGIGSADGEILPIKDEQGNYVKSRLNESLLQKIASVGNGFYLPLRGANPIETLYARGLEPLPKSDPTTKLARVYQERYHWFLALAILCMIAEMLIPERKNASSKPPAIPSARAVKALSILLLGLVSFSANASPSSAMRQYNSGKFDLSEKEYERLAQKDTNDYRLRYNAGTAAYQAKEYEAAEKQLTKALESPNIASDVTAQERALFNLGNTQVQLGSEKWPSAVTNYARALQINPTNSIASNNLAYVQRKLQELKQQQQQQKSQQQKNNKDQDQDQQQQQQQQSGKQDQKDQQQSAQQRKSDQQNQQSQSAQQQQGKDKDKQEQQAAQARAAQDKDKEKQEQEAAAAQGGDEKDKGEEQRGVEQGQMSRQDAERILNAQESDEKPLIFQPDEKEQRHSQDGPVRDW
jgi:Ca-activated chloride channel family protein